MTLRLTSLALVGSLAFAAPALAHDAVLSIGGSTTEIIYALGEQDRLVGRDSTSTWPEAATELPDVGYMRALSPEGVLSVSPDLIIAESGSGPAETIDVLKESGVEFIEIADGFDAAAVRAKIEAVGAALGAEDAAATLADEVEAQISAAAEKAAAHEGPAKRVMFILSLRGGRIMASGTNTAADGIIALAGAENAVAGFEGYKPLSDEAIAAANPDVILMMDRGGDHGAAAEELWAMPSLTTTKAAEDGALVRMNGLMLLGFGPRTGEAVEKLSEALYGG